jgi:hypothetical protein
LGSRGKTAIGEQPFDLGFSLCDHRGPRIGRKR